LQLEWISASEGKQFAELVNTMTKTLLTLGPSKVKRTLEVEHLKTITLWLPIQPIQKPKLKLAIYWGAACGGCCVSVLDTHEKLLDIVAAADPVFWPIAMDIKYKDVEAMPDKIDLT